MSILAVFPKLLNRKWWLTTVVVIIGVIVLIRLGNWQLDRRDQKIAFNNYVAGRWNQEPFDVNTNEVPSDLTTLEYRRVQAEGKFDYSNQILLSNQTYNQAPGSVIVTPYVLDDNHAVLVARGWIPTGSDTPETWSVYNEPTDEQVIGLFQKSQLLPNGNAPTHPDAPQVSWYQINIDAIQPQMPYELLPVFILQLPEEGRTFNDLPLREEPLTLDEGNHFSYAIQWYTFGLILGVGYIFFIRTQELRDQRIAGTLKGGVTQEMDGEAELAPISHRDSPSDRPSAGHA